MIQVSDATLYTGDSLEVLRTLPSDSVHCCVTSPPYFGLRDYGVDGQMGLEPTIGEYLAGMVAVFAEVRRVLRKDGTLWCNMGDSYTGSPQSGGPKRHGNDYRKDGVPNVKSANNTGLKPKDLMGMPWRLAFALQADGWWLRQDIIWAKPNPMPESVTDRCTKSHEYLFMLTKSERYWYDAEAIKEPSIYSGLTGQDESGSKNPLNYNGKTSADPTYAHSSKPDKQRGHSRRHAGFNDRWDAMPKEEQCSGSRNKRSVWTIATEPYSGAHFATFPQKLVEPCIMAGCPVGGTVLDPFGGSGTTADVALRLGRKAILIELNPEYVQLQRKRLQKYVDQPRFDLAVG